MLQYISSAAQYFIKAVNIFNTAASGGLAYASYPLVKYLVSAPINDALLDQASQQNKIYTTYSTIAAEMLKLVNQDYYDYVQSSYNSTKSYIPEMKYFNDFLFINPVTAGVTSTIRFVNEKFIPNAIKGKFSTNVEKVIPIALNDVSDFIIVGSNAYSIYSFFAPAIAIGVTAAVTTAKFALISLPIIKIGVVAGAGYAVYNFATNEYTDTTSVRTLVKSIQNYATKKISPVYDNIAKTFDNFLDADIQQTLLNVKDVTTNTTLISTNATLSIFTLIDDAKDYLIAHYDLVDITE